MEAAVEFARLVKQELGQGLVELYLHAYCLFQVQKRMWGVPPCQNKMFFLLPVTGVSWVPLLAVKVKTVHLTSGAVEPSLALRRWGYLFVTEKHAKTFRHPIRIQRLETSLVEAEKGVL